MSYSYYFISFLFFFFLVCGQYPDCAQLPFGQYECDSPQQIGNTDSVEGCKPNGSVTVNCTAFPGVICNGGSWQKEIPCIYTNGYDFTTTMILSLFLGNFGIDRFYLGYPTIGLIKLFTFGGFIVGNWIDIILIATQTLKPADGSNYVVKINGPRLFHIGFNNNTYQVPQITPYGS